MASSIAQAYVQIIPSAEGIKGKLSNIMGGPSTQAGTEGGKKLGLGMFKAAIKTMGAIGIGKALMATITEGGKLQQSLGGIETLFKGSAGKVKAYAEQSFRTTGLSANAYMENVTSFSASLISSLGGNTKKAADLANTAMVDMSDNANKMGTDMQTITQTYQSLARGNYAMLDNLKLGYGGTKSEMERLMKDAEKLTGEHYTVGDFADTVKAIHAVQKQLGITGTTAKEAATTLTGSFSSMKAAAQDLMGNLAIGKNVMPQLQNLGATAKTFLLGNLIPMIGNIVGQIGTLILQHGPKFLASGAQFLANLAKGFETGFPQLISKIVPLLSQFLKGLQTNFPKFASAGVQIIVSLAKGILNALPIIIAALPGIIKALVQYLISMWPAIKAAGAQLFRGLGEGLKAALPAILGALGQAVLGILGAIGGAIAGVWNGIKARIVSVINVIKSVIVGVWNGIKSATSTVWNGIKSVIGGAINGAKAIISKFKPKLPKINNPVASLVGWVSGAINRARSIINGFRPRLPKLSFPHISLPHFSVSGGSAPWGIGGKGSLPKFHVSWYKKAMDNGMILNNPTIFGAAGGHLLGAGEAGPEAVVGAKSLYRMVQNAAASAGGGGDITVNVYAQPAQDVNQVADAVIDKIVALRRKAVMVSG
jgi:phage-related protein